MIGGMKKTVSRLALAAAASTMAVTGANAADLGGDCCADLEERIAELEVTTARKGNRVVSLEVSGHVHSAIMFWDDGYRETNAYVGTPNTSRSRFRFRGSAKLSSDLSAGYYIEIGIRRNHLASTNQDDPRVTAGLDIRHEALYIDSKHYGRVWMGWTAEAIEGITEINLGGVLTNSPDFNLGGPGSLLSPNGTRLKDFVGVSGEQAGEGNRVNMIRYISPVVAGFTFSSSWGEDDNWAVALRYANEFNGVRVAAGIGYKDLTDDVDGLAFKTNDGYQLGGSASILHVPTGFFLTGQYGENGDDVTNETDDNWYVTAGLKRKFHPLGATTFYGKYGDYERGIGAAAGGWSERSVEAFGFGINQKIDAAAMEIYVAYDHLEAEELTAGAVTDSMDVDAVMVGSRIKF